MRESGRQRRPRQGDGWRRVQFSLKAKSLPTDEIGNGELGRTWISCPRTVSLRMGELDLLRPDIALECIPPPQAGLSESTRGPAGGS